MLLTWDPGHPEELREWRGDHAAGRCHVTPQRGNDRSVVADGLPAIPASAGALVFDQAGRLLILKPTYKSGWSIPGGVMEADGETPDRKSVV